MGTGLYRVRTMSLQHGMSLLELMVAIAIGAILMTGLVAMFNSSADTRRELEKTGALIENGRYAIGLLHEDLRHAGFYGQFYDTGDAPGAAPDPCEVTNLVTLRSDVAMPLQGFRAANLTTQAGIVAATTCDEKNVLPATNFVAGSDILIVRRADTTVFTGTPTAGRIYMQANARDMNLLVGSASANVPTTSANNNVTANLKKYPAKNTGIADTRRYLVHVYFVAPCSYGSGVNGTCTSGDGSVRTLKRLVLEDNGSGATAMTIESLVEGVEVMKVEYGVDTTPTSVNLTTGLIGDGMPDSYVALPASLAEWTEVASVRVYLLVRSTEATQDYTDIKQYVLGDASPVVAGPFGDHYRRRVYSTEVVPVNMAGRREIPN